VHEEILIKDETAERDVCGETGVYWSKQRHVLHGNNQIDNKPTTTVVKGVKLKIIGQNNDKP